MGVVASVPSTVSAADSVPSPVDSPSLATVSSLGVSTASLFGLDDVFFRLLFGCVFGGRFFDSRGIAGFDSFFDCGLLNLVGHFSERGCGTHASDERV